MQYAPNKTAAVWDACWRKGYVRVIIGGGLSSAVQVNDTKLHGSLSRAYTEGETLLLMAISERHPDFLPAMKRVDCIGVLIPIWQQPDLHVQASKGFWENMLANKLDGSEDHRASSDISALWHDLNILTVGTRGL